MIFRVLQSLSFVLVLISASPALSNALDSKMIFNLKKGHNSTCIPNISRQAKSIGLNATKNSVEIYCECLSNFYFNDFTTADYSYLKKHKYNLPPRIEKNKRQIQVYCAELHLYK